MPAGSAIEPLDRSRRLAPFEVFTAAASTRLLWRRQAYGLRSWGFWWEHSTQWLCLLRSI